MMEKVTLEQIKDAEKNTAAAELKNRMLADRDLYRMTPYALKNYKGTKVEASYPITSNKPMVFGNRVISALTGANIKCDIEVAGEANTLSGKIEEGWTQAREAIDAYVSAMGDQDTLSFMSSQAALTGFISCLVWPYQDDDGTLVPYIGEWDSPYVIVERGRKGLTFAANHMTKSKSDVLHEYNTVVEGDDNDTYDTWQPRLNEVYIGDKVVNKDTDTGVDFTPVIHQQVGASAFARDVAYGKYRGESIYAGVRDWYGEYNRQLSVRNTLTMWSFSRSMQYRSAEGESKDLGGKNYWQDISVFSVPLEGGFEPMPVADINEAAKELILLADHEIVQQGLSTIEYGEIPDDATVAQLNTMLSKTMSFLNPRMRAIEAGYNEMAYMFMRLMKDRGLPNECVIKGRTYNIPTFDIGPEITIRHKLVVKLPLQEIANFVLAKSAQGWIDLERILKDIIGVDDVADVMEKLKVQKIYAFDPRIEMWDIVNTWVESKDPEDKNRAAFTVSLHPEIFGQPQVPGVPGAGQPSVPGVTPQEPPTSDTSALPALLKGGA